MLKKILMCVLVHSSFLSAQNNTITLQSYEANIQAYIDGTPQIVGGEMQAWLDTALGYISKESLIFEIGSGFGRDASYMQCCGYQVQTSDATQNFVQLLRTAGFDCYNFNVLTDVFARQYDMIYANAVFLHIAPVDLAVVLDKIHGALRTGGVLAFSVKNGTGEGWSYEKLNAPRYFYYWQADAMQTFLLARGFEVVFLKLDTTQKWLYVIAKKS